MKGKYPQDKLSFKILELLAKNKVTIFIPLILYAYACWLEKRRTKKYESK